MEEFLCLDIERDGDDWGSAINVLAIDSEDAARDAAIMFDDGCDAHEREICVKDRYGKITKWEITYDYSIYYYADEVTS